MEGQQLPKATMNAFVKGKTSYPFSAEYLQKVLSISKEFIVRLSDKANNMCESNNKKTISAEHLESALTDFGLTNHLTDLKSLEDAIKEQNQLKREASQRLEEMLAKDLQEEREKRRVEQQEKKQVTVRERFQELQKVDDKGNDDDYENIVDLDQEDEDEPNNE